MRISNLGGRAFCAIIALSLQFPAQANASDLYLPKDISIFLKDESIPEYHSLLTVWSAIKDQDFETARSQLAIERAKFPDSMAILLAQIFVEYYEGNETVAMPMIEEALKKYPGNKELLILQAMVFCNDEHPAEAAEIYSKLIDKYGASAELLRLRANAFIGQFKLDAARRDIEQCLALEPRWKNPLHTRGRIAFYEGRLPDALADYSEAIKDQQDPNLAEIYEDRSAVHKYLMDFGKAKADLDAADKVTYFSLSSYYESLELARSDYETRERNLARRFLIAVGFPLSLQNDYGLCSLTGRKSTEEARKKALESMKRIWQFSDRKSVLNTIWFLTCGAGNDEWSRLCKAKSRLKGTEEQIRRQLLDENHDMSYAKIDLVMRYGDEFGERGVSGYDYGRSTNLCRDAVCAGLLSEHEGLEIMLYNAGQVQSKYKSWQQYHREYLVGRMFWNPDIQAQDEAPMQLSASTFLLDPKSVLNTIPWDTKLSAATVFPGEKSTAAGAEAQKH